MSKSKELPIKFIPHKRFIKAAILAGLHDDEINTLCAIRSFNILPEYIMMMLRDECREIPGGEEMMNVNRMRYTRRKGAPLINQSVVDTFKHKAFFVDIINMLFASKGRRMYGGSFRVLEILKRTQERQFLEISALQSEPLTSIVETYSKMITDKINKKAINTILSTYYSYFWTANKAAMLADNVDIYDVSEYIRLDPHNDFYKPHRGFMFLPHMSLRAYFGLVSSDERSKLNNELWGKMYLEINNALNSKSKAMIGWIPGLFKSINDTLANEEEILGMEYYRDKLAQIMARVVSLADVRKTRDDIQREVRKDIVPEQDEIIDPRERMGG